MGRSRDVRSGSGWLDGPIKDIQRLVLKSLLRCFVVLAVLRVVVLLEGGPLPQSEVLSALEQVFIKDLLRSSFPRS